MMDAKRCHEFFTILAGASWDFRKIDKKSILSAGKSVFCVMLVRAKNLVKPWKAYSDVQKFTSL